MQAKAWKFDLGYCCLALVLLVGLLNYVDAVGAPNRRHSQIVSQDKISKRSLSETNWRGINYDQFMSRRAKMTTGARSLSTPSGRRFRSAKARSMARSSRRKLLRRFVNYHDSINSFVRPVDEINQAFKSTSAKSKARAAGSMNLGPVQIEQQQEEGARAAAPCSCEKSDNQQRGQNKGSVSINPNSGSLSTSASKLMSNLNNDKIKTPEAQVSTSGQSKKQEKPNSLSALDGDVSMPSSSGFNLPQFGLGKLEGARGTGPLDMLNQVSVDKKSSKPSDPKKMSASVSTPSLFSGSPKGEARVGGENEKQASNESRAEIEPQNGKLGLSFGGDTDSRSGDKTTTNEIAKVRPEQQVEIGNSGLNDEQPDSERKASGARVRPKAKGEDEPEDEIAEVPLEGEESEGREAEPQQGQQFELRPVSLRLQGQQQREKQQQEDQPQEQRDSKQPVESDPIGMKSNLADQRKATSDQPEVEIESSSESLRPEQERARKEGDQNEEEDESTQEQRKSSGSKQRFEAIPAGINSDLSVQRKSPKIKQPEEQTEVVVGSSKPDEQQERSEKGDDVKPEQSEASVSDPKSESRSESESEIEEPKSPEASKSKSNIEPESESRSESGLNPEFKLNSLPKLNVQPKSKSKLPKKEDFNSDPKLESNLERESEPKSNIEAKFEKPEFKSELRPESQTERKSEPESSSEPKAELKSDSESELESDPKSESNSKRKGEAKLKPSISEPKLGPKIKSSLESMVKPQGGPEAKFETKSEPKSEPKSESRSETNKVGDALKVKAEDFIEETPKLIIKEPKTRDKADKLLDKIFKPKGATKLETKVNTLDESVNNKAEKKNEAIDPKKEAKGNYSQQNQGQSMLGFLHPLQPYLSSPQASGELCSSSMYNLRDTISEVLALVEHVGQHVLSDESVDYLARDSLSHKLAKIRAAADEARMAASLGQLKRLSESARLAGVELMRLAAGPAVQRIEPNLRQLALKMRKSYIAYRKACKNNSQKSIAK